jgi:hypothetical protein
MPHLKHQCDLKMGCFKHLLHLAALLQSPITLELRRYNETPVVALYQMLTRIIQLRLQLGSNIMLMPALPSMLYVLPKPYKNSFYTTVQSADDLPKSKCVNERCCPITKYQTVESRHV